MGNALPLNLMALWRCGLLQMLCYPFVVSNGNTALYNPSCWCTCAAFSVLLLLFIIFFKLYSFCVYPLLIATESVC